MTIRWGIIGCGDIVRKRVAAAIQMETGSQLQAACRRDGEKLADFCRQFGVPRAYRDTQSLLDDPDIDAVYIATPVSAGPRYPTHHILRPEGPSRASGGKRVTVPVLRTLDQTFSIPLPRPYGRGYFLPGLWP